MTKSNTEIYLDSNATTPVLPEAANQAFDAMEDLFGNPSSAHTSGLRARFLLESTRDLVRSVLGAGSGEIVFTSGATEAIQMAIFSTLCTLREKCAETGAKSEGFKLLYTATEHKAVPQALMHWNRLLGTGCEVVAIPVDSNGTPDLEFIAANAGDAAMVCTMSVNNETGVIHDLAAIEKSLRTNNESCVWLVDCVQAVGKMKLNLAATTINYAAASGHKIYSPKGIGLLYVRENTPMVPMMAGGGQESGARGGTENLPGVAAIATVLQLLNESPSATFAPHETLEGYRDQLVASLKEALPTIVFNTPFEHAVPTTINFAVRGFSNKELLDLFDAAGIRVSSGSACGSDAVSSYVLDAMGLELWRSEGAIRMSFGPLNTESEIHAACQRILSVGMALCDACVMVSETPRADSRPLDGLVQLKRGSMCTWLLMDSKSKRCIIIDPFEELAERIETLVLCQQSNVVAILDTHNHVDHDSPRKMLLQVLGDHVLPVADGEDLLGWPDQADGTVTVGNGELEELAEYVRLAGTEIMARIQLPGHTVISCAYLVGTPVDGKLSGEHVRFAFTGDTILMGGIGRTDFESSTIKGMFDSLNRLPKIICADSTVICPTHDYNNEFTTTLAAELQTNEFLASVLDPVVPMRREDFIAAKPGIDVGITDETNSELVCGLIKDPDATSCESSLDIPPDGLKEFFDSHRGSVIIDVREPHEFSFAGNWEQMGLDAPPRNIPLTRLCGFLPELLAEIRESGADVVFLCRSGRRSGRAASVVRRLGIEKSWHISGGIALNSNSRECELADPGYVI